MSRIYFTSPSDDAEVLGRERAYMGIFVRDMAAAFLPFSHFGEEDRLRDMLPADHYLRRQEPPSERLRWEDSYRLALGGGFGEEVVQWNGQPVEGFSLTLNTVMAVGNDAARLLARLHAQCEIHAWVDGPNRAWLADIIQHGLDVAMFRRGMKWEEVITMLRKRDDEPVATWFSVTDGFPNAECTDWMPPWPEGVPLNYNDLTPEQQRERDERQDAYYELSTAEQWQRGIAWLRSDEGGAGLEMKPDDWASYRFGHCLSVLDLAADDYAARLDAVRPAKVNA